MSMNDLDRKKIIIGLYNKLNLFPLFTVGADKRPAVESWKDENVYIYSNELEENAYKRAFGLVTGEKSNIMVIDLDNKPDKDGNGIEEFQKILDELGVIVDTFTVKTPNNGLHLYFKYREGLKNTAGILPGVDIRTQGGYIITPYSKISAGMYKVVNAVEIQEMDDKLFNKLKELCNKGKNKASQGTNNTNSTETLTIDFTKVKEGSRNETLFTYIINYAEHELHSTHRKTLLTIAKCANNEMPEPLEEKEVETIVDSAIKTLLDKEMEAKGSYGGALYSSLTFNKNNTISVDQLRAGDAILNEYDFINTERFFYKYNPKIGLWEKYSKQALLSLVTKDLKTHCNYWSDTVVRGLTNQVFNNTYSIEDGRSFDQVFNKNPYSIVFKNGTLDFKTGIFEEAFYKEDYNTIIIPHNYNEKADRPIKTINFLSMMTDSTEEMTFIFEWIGYLLVKSYPIAKMLFLVGNGGNGKSTLIKLMTSIVGENNTSAVSIKSLVNNRFQGALLYNKLFNTVADIGADFFEDSSIIKALTGDDTITVERKGENGFSYSNFAKMTYSCNKLPKFKDNSAGLERRPIILNLNKDFMDIVQSSGMHINDIINDEEEIEKIIAYSVVNFMQVLRNNNTFTESEDMRKAKSDWLNDDPLVDFVGEVFEITKNKEDFILLSEFMSQYNQYCTSRNYKPLSQARVIDAIKNNKEFINNTIKITRVSNKNKTYKVTGIKSNQSLQWYQI